MADATCEDTPQCKEELNLLRRQLQTAHKELDKTSSELLQLTLELDDRVEARTKDLRESEAELRRHRDHLEELVQQRTSALNIVNLELARNLNELRASEARFESLVRTIPDIVYRISPEGLFTFVNEAVQRLGYAPDELLGLHFSSFIHSADGTSIDRPTMLPPLSGKQTGAGGAPKLVDERRTGDRKTTALVVRLIPKASGRSAFGLLNCLEERIEAEINSAGLHAPAMNGNLKYIGTVGVIRDITERRKIESQLQCAYATLEQRVVERTRDLQRANMALAQSEKNYRALFDNAADIIMLVGLDGRILDMNHTGITKYGYPREEILRMNARELLAQHESEEFATHVRQAERFGKLTVDSEHMTATGHVFPVEVRIRIIEFEGVKALLGLVRDMTARKENEKRLRDSREMLQSILDGMGAAVFYVDPRRYVITETNVVGQKLLGILRENIVGAHCCTLICPDKLESPGKYCPLFGSKILNTEKKLELPNGRIIPIIKNVLTAEIDGVPHNVEIIFDLSERKELERRLALAQKLESVGQLAAGIAHEINTPIQYIDGNLEYIARANANISELLELFARAMEDTSPEQGTVLRRQVREMMDTFRSENVMEELSGAIKDSRSGIEQVASIVRAMKRFSHPGGESKCCVDVNSSIQSAITVSRNEWKYSSRMQTDLAEDLPMLCCHPGDINQLLLNILVNAAHANSQRHKDGNMAGLIRVTSKHSDGNIVITIEDNGTGIPLSIQNKIFDPFFTTKEVGKGTGQGLAIAHDIASKHNGFISFTSVEGQGTTFTITIPLTENEASSSKP